MFGKYWIVFGWNGVTETLIPDFMLILVEMGTQSSDILNDEDDPITGVIGNSGKYQLLICVLIAFFEVC